MRAQAWQRLGRLEGERPVGDHKASNSAPLFANRYYALKAVGMGSLSKPPKNEGTWAAAGGDVKRRFFFFFFLFFSFPTKWGITPGRRSNRHER